MEVLEPSRTADGNVKWWSYPGTVYQFLSKELPPYDPRDTV